MFDLSNIVRFSYWLALSTPPFRRLSLFIMLALLAGVFAVGLILRFAAKGRRHHDPPLAKALMRMARPLFFFAVLGALFVAFRQLGALVLSARIWLMLTAAIAVAWGTAVFRRVHKTLGTDRARLQADVTYKQYLPKRKR